MIVLFHSQMKVCVLFVRNLASNLSNGNVERVRKFDINESRSYAFVHFVTREAAEKALALVFWRFSTIVLKIFVD